MENENLRSSKLFRWVLVLGIIVVLNLLFNYSIHLFYPAPQYDKFCPESPVSKLQTETECVRGGGAWTETPPPAMVEGRTPTPTGYCDPHFACRQLFSDAEAVYNRNVFLILVVLGVAAVIAGWLVATAPVVSLGLALGGVLSFIVGAVRYWSEMQDYLRIILLALALAVLIWLGVKKLKK